METQRFLDMLHRLQSLQGEVALGGIHSFEITTRYYKSDPDCGDEPDELGIYGHVFLRGDDTEEDYLSFGFHEAESDEDWYRTFNNLKAFVSCFL